MRSMTGTGPVVPRPGPLLTEGHAAMYTDTHSHLFLTAHRAAARPMAVHHADLRMHDDAQTRHRRRLRPLAALTLLLSRGA